MTEEMNEVFKKLECNAIKFFDRHRIECEKIAKLLVKMFPEECEKINDVIYQPSDGIVVVYEDMKNIPLNLFLNGFRV